MERVSLRPKVRINSAILRIIQALKLSTLFEEHMNFRTATRLGAITVLAAAALSAQTKAAWKMPRTADGKPDLQGIWTNATLTPMERPAAFAGKATLSDAEATAYEKKDIEQTQQQDGASDGPLIAAAGSSGTGGYNFLFIDRGSQLARVDGVKRTSLVIDPPDGKVPAITPAARERNRAAMTSFMRFNSVQDRPMSERCLIGFGSTSGPPMLPVLYNNNYQIVQNADTVMILVEMVHDVRIIRINGTHPARDVQFWLGDSIGHWEGDTLVVDTTNFTAKSGFRGTSTDLHVIERFTRADTTNILYKATIDDPTTFAKQWTMEFPFTATNGPVYEYACHEGNYAMEDILGGARKSDAAKK